MRNPQSVVTFPSLWRNAASSRAHGNHAVLRNCLAGLWAGGGPDRATQHQMSRDKLATTRLQRGTPIH